MIDIVGLEVRYGTLAAVDGLDLCVAEGARFGLLGPNGAGKTTTISVIAGLQTPTRGTVRVAGIDAVARPEAVRAVLGVVPQALALYAPLSVVTNLKIFAGLMGLYGARLRERVAWGLALAQLEGKADARVETLSGGMKRRLNLACSLLHDPQVIICDEPTTGVDPQSRNHLFETIRTLQNEGRTVVYTTHYMEEVETLCDEVAIIDHGRILARDALAAFLQTTRSTRRYDLELSEAADVDELRRRLEALGLTVERLAATPRSLEEVFLELTGRTLRDST